VKTQFLATMSHELRTPLNAIGGYAELLEMGSMAPSPMRSATCSSGIQRSQHHLLSLINNVLNLVKLDTHHVRFDIVAVPIESVLKFVSETAGPVARGEADALRDARLHVRTSPSTPTSRSCARSSSTCSPTRSSSPRRRRDRDRVPERRAQRALRVEDTGVGIAADQQEKIFEPFVQVDRRLNRPMEGTGLGARDQPRARARDGRRAHGGESAGSGLDVHSLATARSPP
jgi:signal transduction histidine kinase